MLTELVKDSLAGNPFDAQKYQGHFNAYPVQGTNVTTMVSANATKSMSDSVTQVAKENAQDILARIKNRVAQ